MTGKLNYFDTSKQKSRREILFPQELRAIAKSEDLKDVRFKCYLNYFKENIQSFKL